MSPPVQRRLPRAPGPVGCPAVVAFGGGHGLAASLTALRRITDQLTAIVTVADDGGSSGRLRGAQLPTAGRPADGAGRALRRRRIRPDLGGRAAVPLRQHGPLAGHAIGNLLIAGLWERLGDPVAGLDMVARLLGAEGRVLPMASVPLEIEADVIGLDPASPTRSPRSADRRRWPRPRVR